MATAASAQLTPTASCPITNPRAVPQGSFMTHSGKNQQSLLTEARFEEPDCHCPRYWSSRQVLPGCTQLALSYTLYTSSMGFGSWCSTIDKRCRTQPWGVFVVLRVTFPGVPVQLLGIWGTLPGHGVLLRNLNTLLFGTSSRSFCPCAPQASHGWHGIVRPVVASSYW